MRKNIEKMELGLHGQTISVTISCGVSHTIAGDDKTSEQLVNEADMALYEAKRLGRNQTAIFNTVGDNPAE